MRISAIRAVGSVVWGSLVVSTLSIAAQPVALAASAPASEFNRLLKQGRAALAAGDLESARTLYEQACPSSGTFGASGTALCEHELGALDHTAGRLPEAEGHYLRALSAWDRTGAAFTAPHVITLTNLAEIYESQNRKADAARALGAAFEIAEPLRSANPRLFASVLSRLGELRGETDPDNAGALLNEAVATLRGVPSGAPELAHAYDALGMLSLRTGAYDTGESWLRKALSMVMDFPGANDPEIAAYETNLGLALCLQERFDEAMALLRHATAVFEAHPDQNALHLGTALAELSTAEAALGKFGLAEEDGARACAVLARQFSPESTEAVLATVDLAMVYLDEKKIAEADRILPDVVAAERLLAPESRPLGDSIRALARLRAGQHRWREAESLYREAISLYEATLSPGHPVIGRVRGEYAGILKHRVPSGVFPA